MFNPHYALFQGINVCHPSPAGALKLIAGQICSRDNGVRTSALNTLVAAYNILGETVYKYVGKVSLVYDDAFSSWSCLENKALKLDIKSILTGHELLHSCKN